MDLSRKTIQTLTVSLDEKREEMAAFYRQFGERLFIDSTDPAVLAGALSNERTEIWRTLMAERETDTQTIVDIKTALNRQQEIARFRKELKMNLSEENKCYLEQLERLGKTFYTQYTEEDSDVFGDTYEKATTEGNSLVRLEEKQQNLQQELKDAGFFGKMFAQFRIAGIASKIRQQKLRVTRIFSDGGASLVSSGILEKRKSLDSVDRIMSDIYSEVLGTAERIKELKKRDDSVEIEISGILDLLKSFNADINPLRRIDELRAKVKECDKRLDSLTVLSAREYSDKFLDENGISLLGNGGDGHTFSDMGSYSHQLEQIALYRSEISLICRKIEILETSLKIESLNKQIVDYERSIADYERKIQNFKEMTEKLRTKIVESTEERVRLCEHKEEVEKTLPSV